MAWRKSVVVCGLVAVVAVLLPIAASARVGAPACMLDVSTTQICPVQFKATEGKSVTVTVARYDDFSHCSFPSPPNEPADNGNYVVRSVSINWGDGTRPSSGIAHRGKGCPGTSVMDSRGVTEPITGIHRYKKVGTYTVLVSIIYVAGKGDTFKNCAPSKYRPGNTAYSITNCIALKAPAHTVAIVRKA